MISLVHAYVKKKCHVPARLNKQHYMSPCSEQVITNLVVQVLLNPFVFARILLLSLCMWFLFVSLLSSCMRVVSGAGRNCASQQACKGILKYFVNSWTTVSTVLKLCVP